MPITIKVMVEKRIKELLICYNVQITHFFTFSIGMIYFLNFQECAGA